MSKANRLSVPCYSTSAFAWAGKVGVADASSMPEIISRQVWSDACDIGFEVKSDRTGTEKLFTFVGEFKVNGETAGWHYESDDGFKVKIFND